MHVEFLVEEESCAEFLRILIPKLIGDRATFETHAFQGKKDLLQSLPSRLQAYSSWLLDDWRILVLTDRDNDDCLQLKAQLDDMAHHAGLVTRFNASPTRHIQIINRIAVEELEAWFFGDVQAIVTAYPNVPATLDKRRGFRNSDAVAGGTWEQLERVLQRAGYYAAGMPKVEVARRISQHLLPARNRSKSFQVFCEGVRTLIA